MPSTLYYDARPIRRVVSFMKYARVLGHRIVINTARGMATFRGDAGRAELEHRQRTEEWLFKNGVPYDTLLFGKPSGDMYFDDKGVCLDELED
jgi:hypothetical protein